MAVAIEPRLITVKQAAALLGVSHAKAGMLVRAGDMPGLLRLPGNVAENGPRGYRVKLDALNAWIDDNSNKVSVRARPARQ